MIAGRLRLLLLPALLGGCLPGRARVPASSSVVPPAQGAFAFVDVRVVPMDDEHILDGQTVLVEGGRILAVGPTGALPVPAGATRIDGQGRYLLPGLVDMHAHLDSQAALTLSVAAGVTTVRNMWGGPLQLAFRAEVARGARLGPTIYTAGPIVDGAPPDWPGSEVVESAEDAARVVRAQRQAGYDFIKVYNNLTPAALDAVVAEAKRTGLTVVGHTPRQVGLGAALDGRLAGIEHLTGYLVAAQAAGSPFAGTTALPHRRHLALHVDEARLPGLARATAQAGVASCVTLTVDQWFLPGAELRRLADAPEMRLWPPSLRAAWLPPPGDPDAPPQEYQDNLRAEAVLAKLVAELARAGAPLLVGTDSPNPLVVPGFAVARELANLVAAGLRPFEALAAATREPARFLGAAGEFGRVAPGLRADLLLLDDNPLADVGNVSRVAGVMVRGRWLPRVVLDALVDRLVASYAPPADRFAGRPPLSLLAGPPLRYAKERGGVVFGEERTVVEARPEGRVLLAEEVEDEPDPRLLRTTLALDAQAPAALILDGSRAGGALHAEVSRTAAALVLHGRDPLVGEVFEEVPIAPLAPLVGPTLAGRLPLVERLARERPGVAVEAACLVVEPQLQLLPCSFRATRLGAQLHVEAQVGRWRETLDAELAEPEATTRQRPVRRLSRPDRGGTVQLRLLTAPASAPSG